MKNFIGGGSELPQGQSYVCSIVQDRSKLSATSPLGLLRRNDASYPKHTAYSLWPKACLIIFCVLFSGYLVSPAYGQEAEGLHKVQPLTIGSKVPDDFWTREHLFYVNGDTVRMTLEEYKGKMLVLGFWATWCSSCLQHQKPIANYLREYADKLAVIKVNTIRTKDTYASIKRAITGIVGKHNDLDSSNFSSIIEDNYLLQLFPHGVYPHYVWINKAGQVQMITYRNLLDPNYRAPFVN